MKINSELIQRCSSKNLLPVQSGKDPLQRITHLYLQEQNIRTIENLHLCSNLLALYLYDNKIQKIENLDHLTQLHCLYLQTNRIARIENLQALSQLTVLNLSHNVISKLEGLETLCELRELYMEYQCLPDDQSLEFDPPSISSISETLKVLNLSGNNIKSLCALKPLQHLTTFMAEENDLKDLHELVDVVAQWKCVQLMKLNGNPLCRIRKYRDNIVVSCLELEELDGRVVSQSYRNFLLNWKQCQALQNLKKESYAVLKPFLETQIRNKQLSPPRPSRSSSVSSRPSSVSSSQSESSVGSKSKSRSKSAQRRADRSSKAMSLQEMPLKLVKKITKGM